MTDEELRSLEARWRVGDVTPEDLHGIANGLLAKGEDHERLIELFALERDELRWKGADAFESLLEEWGGGRMGESEAVAVVVRDLAAGVVAGTITPLEATRRADAINNRTAWRHGELIEWRDLYEEIGYVDTSGQSYLGRDRATIEADVIDLARDTLARGGSS